MALAGIEARTFNGDVAEDRAVPNLPPSFATQLSITACTACAFDAKRLALRGNNFLLDAQKNNFAFLYGQADITGRSKPLENAPILSVCAVPSGAVIVTLISISIFGVLPICLIILVPESLARMIVCRLVPMSRAMENCLAIGDPCGPAPAISRKS